MRTMAQPTISRLDMHKNVQQLIKIFRTMKTIIIAAWLIPYENQVLVEILCFKKLTDMPHLLLIK